VGNASRKGMNDNPNAFKHSISKSLLERISESLGKSFPRFNKKQFMKVAPQLSSLELKQRVHLIRDELQKQLPDHFPQALEALLASVELGNLRGFDLWPYTEFVQTFGLDHAKISLDGLKKLTPLFTSEFAVRPFLKKHQKSTLAYLLKATTSKDSHVRRWASEGSRPRLPWGERLGDFIKNPQLTLPILENLKYDHELYVRKSVANHLNDIAKDHPQLVIDTLKRWKKTSPAAQIKNIDWILRHSLRSLIKAGNPGALQLIGATANTKIHLSSLKISKPEVKINDHLEFGFQIQSRAKTKQKLIVDYIIHFRMANDKTSAKVFKLKTLELPPNEKVLVQKKHSLKKITTRRYYKGEHFVEIQVNGKAYAKSKWLLK
jgi:3-methyladenine DNA glycosylase AlkC